MKNRRRITQEDVLVTEALIAESYGRVKKSVFRAPSQAFGSVSGTISRHPFAAAAIAIAGGIAAYLIISRITSHVSVAEQKRNGNRPDLVHEILSMLIPVAAPYVTGYIQKNIGRILSGERE